MLKQSSTTPSLSRRNAVIKATLNATLSFNPRDENSAIMEFRRLIPYYFQPSIGNYIIWLLLHGIFDNERVPRSCVEVSIELKFQWEQPFVPFHSSRWDKPQTSMNNSDSKDDRALYDKFRSLEDWGFEKGVENSSSDGVLDFQTIPCILECLCTDISWCLSKECQKYGNYFNWYSNIFDECIKIE